MYITREIESKILGTFSGGKKKGLILAGIVGSGKTTVVTKCLSTLSQTQKIFEFTGDDFIFRSRVQEDSKYVFNEVVSQTEKHAIVFVDEVQKSEAIFDAVKYAFDHADISFIVTGSNPEYLATVARKRLQRRAEFWQLLPFSLPELIYHQKLSKSLLNETFREILIGKSLENLPNTDLTLSPVLEELIKRYLVIGGLPLAFLSSGEDSFLEIRKTVERGFEPIYLDAKDLSEILLEQLAALHSREFTYTNIFKKTGLRRREVINNLLLQLKGHGYLVSKKPFFFSGHHRSYLTVYSLTDPGIVTYLSGNRELTGNLGYRVEGIIHTRLSSLKETTSLKSELGYFKPYKVVKKDEIQFLPGEIDFIFFTESRKIPIEVKAARDFSSIDTGLMTQTIQQHKLAFGIVLYGGVPYVDRKNKILYWPWWGV